MSFIFRAAAVALFMTAAPLFAQSTSMHAQDAYARVSGPTAKSGAVFMMLENRGAEDDRLIDAASDVAAKVELHTHIDDGNGVMQMRHVPDGFAVNAGASHMLERGADHVMLMGLSRSLAQGDTVTLTLTFEKAGVMVIDVPVDLNR